MYSPKCTQICLLALSFCVFLAYACHPQDVSTSVDSHPQDVSTSVDSGKRKESGSDSGDRDGSGGNEGSTIKTKMCPNYAAAMNNITVLTIFATAATGICENPVPANLNIQKLYFVRELNSQIECVSSEGFELNSQNEAPIANIFIKTHVVKGFDCADSNSFCSKAPEKVLLHYDNADLYALKEVHIDYKDAGNVEQRKTYTIPNADMCCTAGLYWIGGNVGGGCTNELTGNKAFYLISSSGVEKIYSDLEGKKLLAGMDATGKPPCSGKSKIAGSCPA
ncbi:hypothetical protein L596_025290 [Steinernema carpocapsae]|uniref:Uncharacterized protein n=1 Tax=Steinernema carpocapsae TaxID=34508 RepID=A0A4U5M7C6_STECR|nr:hypothetical protein L596_025290 [Steinernema carpocapsae]